MAIVYFDSSAFVKRFWLEEDGSVAAASWDGCDVAVSSRSAYREVSAVLAAARRAHRLGAEDQHQAQTLWEEYLGSHSGGGAN